jgi:DNA-binding CsgD family transcriptional regulator
LSRLSPQELRCWTLRAEGLRYREIAEILEIRTGTVATLLVRAAEKLAAACPDRAEPWATAPPSFTEGKR